MALQSRVCLPISIRGAVCAGPLVARGGTLFATIESHKRRLTAAASKSVTEGAHMLVVENTFFAFWIGRANVEVSVTIPWLPRMLALPVGLAVFLLLRLHTGLCV